MSQKVGGVLIDIATNIAKVQKDFAHIQGIIKKFAFKAKRELKSVGIQLGLAFSVYQIKRFITEGAASINMMQDMAQSAGISAKNFQGLAHAASYSGVEAEGVARALKRLNTNILDANYNLLESKRLFDDLGIKYRATNGDMRDTWEVYKDLSNKLAEMGDNSREAGLANKFLGRAGAGMIPTMNMTSKGIENVTKNLEKWGALVTDETMAIMHEVNKNFKDMGAGLRGIKLQVLAGMAEELQQLSTAWVNNQEALSNFVKVGDVAGKVLIKIAVGAAAVAATTEAFGTFLGMMAAAGDYMFFPENLEEVGKKVEGVLQKWNNLMKDLQRPIELDLDIGGGGQGLEGILKLLEDNRQIVAKALKDSKTKVELLDEEYSKLASIQAALRKEKDLAGDLLKIYNALGERMIKIKAEQKRLETTDIWGNMKYGFTDYADKVMDRNKQIQEAVVNGMKTMEDSIVDGLRKGRIEWDTFTNAVLADITRIIVRQQITGPLASWMGGTVDGSTPAKVPIGTGGNVIPSPIPTTPTARGRRSARGRVGDSTVNLSNDLQNIVAENTYLMNRDVEEFVKNSETQFRRLGRTLNRSLNADEFGKGGVLGSPTGYSYPGMGGVTGGPAISGSTASAGGIDTSDLTEKLLGDTYEKVNDFLNDSKIGNPLKDAVKLANDIFLGPIHEFIEDPTLGNFGDMIVAPVVAPIQKAGDIIEDVWKSVFGRRRGGDSGGGGNTIINVPVSIEGGNSAMASEMRTEIEKTVIEVMRRYA